ncbi:S-methyl-5'-thioadenosine phosphorylase [Eurytemora carolleeae]|uniref:S-methyl-5'-thioadenosine phosphorylase n=1 Tax=Eurytemora carolleeae TaxID=1294199 RepID=UPI000C783B07|nr:S-methyl-5'-thioadenosine phosphorylase [Eurytemora carolleeae]|eukprot:XP_023325115.1 S-methyl-5'-thioadenosine phosphorylase-like [Eurytemora affinis]
MSRIKIGIIGGSGFYKMEELQEQREVVVSTPFGSPSAPIVEGRVDGVDVCMLARHGLEHTILPGDINYRANIWALKEIGVTHILSVSACGSLKEEISPGSFVLLDSFLDRTQGRVQSFYGGDGFKGVAHTPMEPAFCSRTRSVLEKVCLNLNYKVFNSGTVVTIQGPRFSSKAESKMYRSLDASVINMTTVPEVCLAKEAGISYTCLALATDYDCWKEDNQVDTPSVLRVLRENVSRVKVLLLALIPELNKEDWNQTIQEHRTVAANSVLGGECLKFDVQE